MLILGRSGIGKSEAALELIQRGHRLVADDVVLIRRGPDGLLGTSPDLIRHHLEIRGIGILYVPDLYGPDSVREQCRVDLQCLLERWEEGREYERVGLERPTATVLGVLLPTLLLPVRPAGSMAPLVEVAARDHRKREEGVVAARRLDARFRDEASGP